MQIAGLTGGIACGKSTVASLLRESGVPVIDADELARRVVEPGRPAYRKILRHFGPTVTLSDGTLDRAALGERVFAERRSRAVVNRATHLPIMLELLRDLARHYTQGADAVVLDAPLLFETRLDLLCAECVVVRVSSSRQLERLIERDALDLQSAERRIAAQMPLEAKVAKARARGGAVIENDGTVEQAALQVRRDLEPRLRPAGRRRWLPGTSNIVLSLLLWVVLGGIRIGESVGAF